MPTKQTAETSSPLADEPGREDRRLQRRAELLEAAITVIRANGPCTTMEQIARAGGVTKPILYRHFGDRDGLIGEIAQRFSNGLLESVSRPLTSSDDPRALLDSTVDGYVAFIEREPNLYGFLVQQPTRRDGSAVTIASLIDLVARQIALVAGEQLRLNGRDTGSAVPWAYGIVGLVHTATDWWVRDQTMSRERFVGYLTDLLWHGLIGPDGQVPVLGGP